MAAAENDRHLLVLDAARGIAAISVMLFHVQKYMFPTHDLTPWPGMFTASYIAVDLFFLMSGVVISRSYDARLLDGSMTLRAFARIRWLRLYPLYGLAILVGFLYETAKPLVTHQGSVDLGAALSALVPNLLFLPNLANKPEGLFPFDPAAWSLSLEWLINIAYAAIVVRWRTPVLALIVLASGGLLIAQSLDAGSIDLGWGQSTYVGGVLRILFSFTLGVILNRAVTAGHLRLPRLGALPLLAGLSLLIYTPFGHFGVVYELACALVVFPFFVLAAFEAQTPSGLVHASGELGRISYAIYILHNALMGLFSGAWKAVLRTSPDSLPAVAAPVLITLIFAGSWLATRWMDEPVRRWLRTRLPGPRPGPEGPKAPRAS
jgi:peptidoglycan/LPS O-acetylase OafA/YrhL